ncbi:hypothetical protein EVJ58_g8492 [Rhodofomes roseus]|uniref:DUF6533 domain-containing protein n=1 Tax=Rhodofomes roseus TaxID=34475 RepID=A0A4Y9XY12_9APHY|nr:hypothetical protein EVJ58_g8492 [Rhodofomes roseus]
MSEGSVDTLLATKYLSGVALTLLLYDHVIHFDREIEFIWLEPASLLSVFVMCELWVREIGLIYIMTVGVTYMAILGNGGDMLLTPLVSWALEGVLNTRLYYKIKQVELNHMHWTPYPVDNQSRTRAVLIYEETEMEYI